MKDYRARILAICPSLEIEQLCANDDGLVNDVVIVNEQLVFRFAKDDAGVRAMAAELHILQQIAPRLPLAVPRPFYAKPGEMAYEFLPGAAFTREILLSLDEAEQQSLADQMGTFIKALHHTPLDEQTPTTLAPTRHEQWLNLCQRMETKIPPLLLPFQRDWMQRLLAYIDDPAHFAFTPRLIHGDLACYHLLYDPAAGGLSGVIDFGVAGAGDPATDIANLLQTYGAKFIRRMVISYPEIESFFPRARFYAQAIELQWILLGLERNENFWFTAHLGNARDIDL
jgi:aminoglycoside 2''-phosphotransferase